MQRNMRSAAASVTHQRGRPGRSRALRGFLQIDDLQDRTLIYVANARGYADADTLDDSGAVRPWPRWEYGLDFIGRGVQPGDGRGAAIGCQDLPVIGDRTRNTGKPRQRRDVPLGVVVDHLDAIARGVRDEHAAGPGIERGVVEVAVLTVRNPDDADVPQRPDDLAVPCGGGCGRCVTC
jgi:hypothetical protein